MSANGISQLPSKEEKQVAKLDVAEIKRQAGGNVSAIAYRALNVYDINLLPSKYSGNASIPNSHPTGLILGRPWTT